MERAKLTFDGIAKEICKREKSEAREVNITDVKRVMRHMLDVLEENSEPEPINICLYTQTLIVRCDATKFIWGEFKKRVEENHKKTLEHDKDFWEGEETRAQSKSRKAKEGE